MNKKHITLNERLQISLLLKKGYSIRDTASALGREHSSISREASRNGGKAGYDPYLANAKARNRRKLSKYQGMKIEEDDDLKWYVVERLEAGWTPEEISGRIKTHDTHITYVSSKGIYRWLYSVKGQLYCFLLPKKRFRPRRRRKKTTKRQMIPNRIGIEMRPDYINERKRFGHFEADTAVSGKRTRSKTALSVICERKALYTRLKKIPSLKPENHNRAIKKMSLDLNIHSITWDNGLENRNHEELATSLDIKNYFCRPYHSWEKGTVENTIGRIRRFLPKGCDISEFSDTDLQKIEDWLNHTPRKCLNYNTPYEVMKLNSQFISKIPSGAIEG